MITEEKRQALIGFVKATFDSLNGIEPQEPNKYDADLEELTKQVFHVALASLEAKPIAWRVTFDEPVTDDYVSEVVQLWAVEPPPGPYLECSERLYTAPPVPLMQPVDLSACRRLWYEHDDLSAEIECIPVRDLKKAIRAAGGEVKK